MAQANTHQLLKHKEKKKTAIQIQPQMLFFILVTQP